MTLPDSLDEVRENIDSVDRQMIELIARRGFYVKQAARVKNTRSEIEAPQRVEQVIAKVLAFSQQFGADSTVTEKVYRATIRAFIEPEFATHQAIQRT
jgi:isochorismate pyruvate lyase